MQLLNLTASLNGTASVHLNLTNHFLLLLKLLEISFTCCVLSLQYMGFVALALFCAKVLKRF